ncbi:MAG TPA: (4Fe-4S)-binding protein [Deltaproteobacteria bacterium]|nr:MAG: (4Fe-4S)-binding protein [Deltaproteobacteria bacterium]RLB09975.1 MAG: (4Fe-4S)-binding protein [Deltaproteobacteria bacterium]HDM76833.1 (4Fe-4S)-binding protein [Deltaproteobacteria bacterium]
MTELVVISGKGGTGKTSIVGAFAAIADNKILVDADVDAADLHLLLNPEVIERHDFTSGHEAVINEEKCTRCGECISLCKFDAIDEDTYQVNSLHCEGCGVCVHFCPEKAIDFPEKLCGEWFVSNTRYGQMVHAQLGIAEENSGKLVSLVRQKGRELAEEKGIDLILTDGPPGVGCPVIAAVGNASAVLVIAEPTVSGRHDLERVLELSEFFNVPAMVCVNKFDLNRRIAIEIEKFCESKNVFFVDHIPFNPEFIYAVANGQSIVERDDEDLIQLLRIMWEKITNKLEEFDKQAAEAA